MASQKMTGQQALVTLLNNVNAMRAQVATTTGEIGAAIAAAVDRDNLHKGAFGLVAKLDRMDALKRADFLASFDLYREALEQRWSREPDILRASAAKGEQEAGPAGAAQPGGTIEKKPRGRKPKSDAAPAKAAGAAPEQDEPATERADDDAEWDAAGDPLATATAADNDSEPAPRKPRRGLIREPAPVGMPSAPGTESRH